MGNETKLRLWLKRNKRPVCTVGTAAVIVVTFVTGALLERFLRKTDDVKEVISYSGKTTEITVEDISNCNNCSSLYQVEYQLFCTGDHNWINGMIVLDVHWSLITKVSLRMGLQTLMKPKLPSSKNGTRFFEASVCVKGGACSVCGSVVSEDNFIVMVPGRLPDEYIFCEAAIEGNEVRVNQVGNYGDLTQPCGVKVYGQVAVINGVRKLLTYAAEGASKIPPNNTHDEYVFVASNAIDGSLETYPQKCFISDKQFNGFAEFHIPISMVTHVEVLNVGENGSTMEGAYVYVCQFPSKVCLPCGVIADTDSGQWAQLYCAGGWIEGNRIRVLHSYNQLQFCEIHVFGMEMGNSTSVASRVVPEHGYYVTGDFYARDPDPQPGSQKKLTARGEVRIGIQPCTQLTSNSGLLYMLDDYMLLHYMQIINCIEDGCGKTKGMKICAWADNEHLRDCQMTEDDTKPGERFTITFREKLLIKHVSFFTEEGSTIVQLCRVEFFGQVLSQ